MFVQSTCLEKHSATVLFAFIRSYPIFQRPNEFFRFNGLGVWEMSSNRTKSAINVSTARRQELSGRFCLENRHGTDSV
jgi:hypothetical protein